MSIVLAHARLGLLELGRVPSFWVPTLLFPPLTYLFLTNGLYRDGDPVLALAGVAAIAVLGVAFFQFGVGIAFERTLPWERYLRTLPIEPRLRMAARVLAALPVAAVAALFVAATAAAADGVSLAPQRWLLLALVLLAGGVPFALAGIALGYVLPPGGAIPIANLVLIASAIAGGLWQADASAGSETAVAAAIPTRAWRELLWAAVGAGDARAVHVASLVLYGTGFGLLAVWGYGRDEGEQFR